MTYSVSLDLGGVTVTVSGDTVDEMVGEYKMMGGDASLLVETMRTSVANWQPGSSRFVHVTGGQLDVPDPATVDAVRTVREAVASIPDDPWADDAPGGSGSPAAESEDVDPWKGTPVAHKTAQRRTASSGGTSRPQGAGTYEKEDKWGNPWMFNLPDAPMCECGERAARFTGVGRTSGKEYTKFKCAKGGPDGDFHNKCGYDEWPPK
jgi:hypothetical protein